jgi:CelD/BcsL family acetyltransferase involved in cellulose biosynthesis
VRTAAAQGWLRLGVLALDGQAIAAQLWLVHDGKASIYKLAYVEGFERYSAGSVLTHALMQHVIDVDQVQEVDYLTGDDGYKQDWMSHRRERRGIVAFDLRTLRGLALAARHVVGKWIKRRSSQ